MTVTHYTEGDHEPVVTHHVLSRVADIGLTLLRIVAGLMLMQHGAQKLFGLLLTPETKFMGAPPAFSQMWIGGVLELFGGGLLALGAFTRVVAFLLSGMLAVAYFQVHAKNGFWPILNRGELAALYSFVFLMFAAVGGGPYSLDGLVMGRRARVSRRGRDTTTAEPPEPWRRRARSRTQS